MKLNENFKLSKNMQTDSALNVLNVHHQIERKLVIDIYECWLYG